MTLEFSRVELPPLWTVAEIKAIHLRITDAAHDADVQQKLDAAQEYVCAFLGAGADPTWTADTAPKMVKATIANLTAYLYENRGDTLGLNSNQTGDAFIWRFIHQSLSFYRDPGIG